MDDNKQKQNHGSGQKPGLSHNNSHIIIFSIHKIAIHKFQRPAEVHIMWGLWRPQRLARMICLRWSTSQATKEPTNQSNNQPINQPRKTQPNKEGNKNLRLLLADIFIFLPKGPLQLVARLEGTAPVDKAFKFVGRKKRFVFGYWLNFRSLCFPEQQNVAFLGWLFLAFFFVFPPIVLVFKAKFRLL